MGAALHRDGRASRRKAKVFRLFTAAYLPVRGLGAVAVGSGSCCYLLWQTAAFWAHPHAGCGGCGPPAARRSHGRGRAERRAKSLIGNIAGYFRAGSQNAACARKSNWRASGWPRPRRSEAENRRLKSLLALQEGEAKTRGQCATGRFRPRRAAGEWPFSGSDATMASPRECRSSRNAG